jgi:hypothetical protein
MREFGKKSEGGHVWLAYLQFLVLLVAIGAGTLLLGAGILPRTTGTLPQTTGTPATPTAVPNCDCDCSDYEERVTVTPGTNAKIHVTTVIHANGRIEHKVRVTGRTGGTSVDLKWHGPQGAQDTEASHHPGPILPPVNKVTWRKLPVDANGQTPEVTISYTPPSDAIWVSDVFTVVGSGWQESVNVGVWRGSPPQARAASRPAATPAPLRRTTAARLDETRWLWHATLDSTSALTLTADLCQDGLDLLQADTSFAALRVPVYPPSLVYTEPYTLPVIFTAELWPHLALLDFGGTQLLTVPLEYRAQYHTFAENELPAAPGERWLALGAVTSPTLTCAGLPELDWWEVQAHVYLDLGGTEGAGQGAVLPLYYCYEGQSPPAMGSTLLSRALGAQVTSYQGWGITCLGPQPLTLQPEFEGWKLGGSTTAWLTPTLPITLNHYLINWTGAPLTFTLDYSAPLAVDWRLYGGTWEAPDLNDPLTPPIRVDADGEQQLWFISDPLPGDTADGPCTFILTATNVTSPTDFHWASDLLWVGDWIAPPPAPWQRYQIYLPLVVKSH